MVLASISILCIDALQAHYVPTALFLYQDFQQGSDHERLDRSRFDPHHGGDGIPGSRKDHFGELYPEGAERLEDCRS